jgi:hypothetical protein
LLSQPSVMGEPDKEAARRDSLVVHEGFRELEEMKLSMLKSVLKSLVVVPFVVLCVFALIILFFAIVLRNFGFAPQF